MCKMKYEKKKKKIDIGAAKMQVYHGKNSSFVRIFASLKRKYSSFVRKNKSLVRFLNIRYLLSLYMHAEIDIL